MIANFYRERLRILLILYFFSENYEDSSDSRLARVFRSEVKIQKIDFLIRYPSYLCFELLRLYEETGVPNLHETKEIVTSIFHNKEPQLKTDEMKRFFYGAYEELNGIISYLTSVNLVVFKSQKSAGLKDIKKEYFITHYAIKKNKEGLSTVPAAQWYFIRCQLISQYFGDLNGSALKNRQYAIEEYRDTPLGNYITDIENQVKTKYYYLFNQSL